MYLMALDFIQIDAFPCCNLNARENSQQGFLLEK